MVSEWPSVAKCDAFSLFMSRDSCEVNIDYIILEVGDTRVLELSLSPMKLTYPHIHLTTRVVVSMPQFLEDDYKQLIPQLG